MNQFKADVDLLTTADSGPRDVAIIRFACFHTTENGDNTRPEDVARWQQDRNNYSSYNVLAGVDGRTVRSNDDNYIPWAAGTTGNRYGVHMSAVGRAARTRDQWLANPRQLEALARWAADVHRRYNLPFTWLTPAELRAGKRGYCGHLEVSRAWGEVDHTDPGPGFPRDVVLARARELAAPPPAKEVNNMSRSSDIERKLDLILDQLAGPPGAKFPGWEQLGNRTVVDALAEIGAALKLPGFQGRK